MAVIPATIFRTVEWHLHHESELVESAVRRRRVLLESAVSVGGMRYDGMPHGKGMHSEATANKAIALVNASREVEQARAWVQTIRQTYDYFDDTPVFVMAAGYYGQDVKLRELTKELGVSEDSLNKQRDKFVSTCALFAAAGGLVKIDAHADSKLYGKSAGMMIIDEM